jgi:serine O-acetyltransferase
VRSLYKWLLIALSSPLLIAYALTDERANIDADAERWSEIIGEGKKGAAAVIEQLASKREYRNLYYYRLKQGNLIGEVLGRFYPFFWPGEPTLFIWADSIGPGLFIQHGFATVIAAESLGENCWVNQQVTIGFKASLGENGKTSARPVLGSNVYVLAGAKVIGGIKLGDNSVVGANAVVVKDVPEGMTAIGVPATYRPRGNNV